MEKGEIKEETETSKGKQLSGPPSMDRNERGKARKREIRKHACK
jgi:hypothetical protein